MRIQRAESVLLIIDIQTRLLPAIDQGDTVVDGARWLLGLARDLHIPVRATEHCPAALGTTTPVLRDALDAKELLEKTWFSAVAQGNLLPSVPAETRQWVVVGTEAHVCVQQTVLDLLAAGQSVYVVPDTVGSRRAADKQLALNRMQQQGASLVSREMVAFEWLERADTPEFRDVLRRYIR